MFKFVNDIDTSSIMAIDIETVRIADDFDDLSDSMRDAWEYKNKQDGEIPEYQELKSLWTKNSSLYAEFSKVCAVSLAFYANGELRCKSFYGENEKEILDSVKDLLDTAVAKKDYRLVGHASKWFDYPFLAKRYIINQIRVPKILDTNHLKPWEHTNLCTNEIWKGFGTGAGSSLQALCAALNIPTSKVDLVGDEVGESFYKGEYKRIGEYCSRDTVATFNVFRRFKGEPIIEFEDVKWLDEPIEAPTLLQKIANGFSLTEEEKTRLEAATEGLNQQHTKDILESIKYKQ